MSNVVNPNEVDPYILWGAFLAAMALALVFTPAAKWLAPKIGAMDIPKDDRRVHNKPMPRFGGMAIFIGVIVSLLIFARPEEKFYGVIIGGTLIYILGVVDDLKELSPGIKLLGQVVCGGIAFAMGIRLEFINNFFGDGKLMFTDTLCFIITILWVVGITNAINLVDGLDGLAAGIAAIASLSIAYAAYIHGQYEVTAAMLAVAGASLGFLPFNFHPAKIFMGDSGSQFLGFCLSTIALIGPTKSATVVAVAIPALVLGLPIFDTVFAFFRRTVRGQSFAVGDKEHLHHRIMRAGFGQRRSVMIMYGISGVMGVVAVLYSRGAIFVEPLALIAIAIMLLYALMSDTSTKRIELNAINIAKEESKEKRRKNDQGSEPEQHK